MSHKIIVDDVSKQFRLQADRPNSLKEMFTRRGRNKEVDHFWALQNVSFEIAEGSMFGLIGHNGSGKSTLLRCIAGIYQPNGGRIQVDGRISTLLELGAGFHPDLSGRENIYMNATMLGMSRKNVDKVFDEIVDFAGVAQFIDSPVKVYSTGMFVRLGFSVAVHVKPEILIIDEVIAVGDEEFQRKCFEHLYKLRREGVTIVVVTHGMATVQTMCDNAAWLDHGVLQEVGPAPAVSLSYLKRVNSDESRQGPLDVEAKVGSERLTPAQHITERGEHWGSGEVRVTSVEFLGADGAPTDLIVSGAPLRIRIGYESDIEVEDPTFGIAIHHEGGMHVTGTNTRLSKRFTGWVDGKGHVEYHTSHLPLLQGSYLVSVAIEDRFSQHTFDRYDYGWHLRIRHEGEQMVHGLVDIGGDWDVE